MKTTKSLALLITLLFASCPALQTKPAIAAVGGMEIAFKSTSGAFTKFISNPKLKIDTDLRTAILGMIATDAQVFQAMQKAHTDWTNAASSVNVAEVIKQLKAIYDLVMESTQ